MPAHLSAFHPDDWLAWTHALSQSFGIDPKDWGPYRRRMTDNDLWTLREDGAIVGGMGVYPLGKWLGGRRIGLAGISAVGIAPGSRGRGLASGMVAEAMRIYRGRGAAIAGLYASTRTVYRKVGFEIAGEKYIYTLRPDRIGVRARELQVTEISGPETQAPEADLTELLDRLRPLYRPGHGNLDRNAAIWDRVVRPFNGSCFAWLFHPGDLSAAEGYVVIRREGHGYPYQWRIVDVQYSTARAIRQILSFLGDQRSMCDKLTLSGGGDDPLLSLLPEQTWEIEEEMPWLVRVLDLPAAFSGRGWTGADGEVTIGVEDPLFPDNSGGWRIAARDGSVVVTRADPATVDLWLDVRAVGPLLTNYAPPSQLVLRGLAEHRAGDLAKIDRIFAGPRPWMRDHY